MARYLVEAHVLEGRLVSELAAAHGVHRSWIYKLLARYREGGVEALQPRSRRPRSCSHGTPKAVVLEIVALRHQLADEGHDCGAATIAYHLAKRIEEAPSTATIWRILKRQGLIVPQPQKRPRCSLIRFEADLPNETWQTDITHWRLAGSEHAEILNFIDDHSRLFLASDAYPTTKPRTSWTASTRQRPCTACRHRCCPTTARCSPPAPATARYCSSQSSSASGSHPRTHGPTTHRPAARSSGYTKHSSATSPKNPPPTASPSYKPNSTRSSTTTTTSGPTEPSTDAHHYRPTTPGSRPNQRAPSPSPTSASETTRSIPTTRSACAT